jgi:DNA-binding NarL/FixJ family response regulator
VDCHGYRNRQQRQLDKELVTALELYQPYSASLVMSDVFSNQKDTLLTDGERQVLALVARGLVNREIADSMCVSTSTVKSYLHEACKKLKARNRAQAVILAFIQGRLNLREVYSLDELVDLLASLDAEAVETVAELLRRKREQG